MHAWSRFHVWREGVCVCVCGVESGREVFKSQSDLTVAIMGFYAVCLNCVF